MGPALIQKINVLIRMGYIDGSQMISCGNGNHAATLYRPFGIESVYLTLYRVEDKPFQSRGDDKSL